VHTLLAKIRDYLSIIIIIIIIIILKSFDWLAAFLPEMVQTFSSLLYNCQLLCLLLYIIYHFRIQSSPER